MKKIIVLGIALLVFITGCGAEPEQKMGVHKNRKYEWDKNGLSL